MNQPLTLTEVFYARRSYTHHWDPYIHLDLHIHRTNLDGTLTVYAKERDRLFIVQADEVKSKHTPG